MTDYCCEICGEVQSGCCANSDTSRRAIIRVSESLLFDVFNWQRYPPEYILTIEGDPPLPKDTKLIAIYYSHCHRAFEAVVQSEFFPRVYPNSELPVFGDGLYVARRGQRIKVVDDSDGDFTESVCCPS